MGELELDWRIRADSTRCSGEQENILWARSCCSVSRRVERCVRDRQSEGRVRGRVCKMGREVLGGTETSRARPRNRS